MEDYKQDIFFYLGLVEKNFNRMLLTGSPVKCDYDKTKKEFFNVDRRAREKLLELASNNLMIYMRLTALADQVDSDTAKRLSLFFNHHAMQSEEVFYSALEDIETKSLSVDDWIDRYFSTLNADQGRIFKTIRNDGNCFWNIFADSLVDPKIHRPELRMGERKEFTSRLNTVNNTVVYETVPTEKSLRQHHYGDQKLEYTKPQSTSYANPAAGFAPPYFGQAADRAGLCVGVSFSVKDCILQRIMFYDGGTIDRNYDHNTREKSERYAEDRVREKRWHTSLAGLQEKGLLENKDEINEVMAGFKWNRDGSSHITVFSNNLENRLLAQLRALDLKLRLSEKFPLKNIVVPISIYPDFSIYTPEEQKKDQNTARQDLKLIHYIKIYDILYCTLLSEKYNAHIEINETLIDTFFKINAKEAASFFWPYFKTTLEKLFFENFDDKKAHHYATLCFKHNAFDNFKPFYEKSKYRNGYKISCLITTAVKENHREIIPFLLLNFKNKKVNKGFLQKICCYSWQKQSTVDFGICLLDEFRHAGQLSDEEYQRQLFDFVRESNTALPEKPITQRLFRVISEKVPFIALFQEFFLRTGQFKKEYLEYFKYLVSHDCCFQPTQKEIDASVRILCGYFFFEPAKLFLHFLLNLTAENQPSRSVLAKIEKQFTELKQDSFIKLKQSVIHELIDYVHSRGMIAGGKFKPGFFTEGLRDVQLTSEKINNARTLIKVIANCEDIQSIYNCLINEKNIHGNHNAGLFSSGYTRQLNKSLAGQSEVTVAGTPGSVASNGISP